MTSLGPIVRSVSLIPRGLYTCRCWLGWHIYCQSSVVCVLCSCLMCPYLVCFLSSSNVIISLVCSAVCVNYPVYLVHACSVWFRLVYSLLPGVSVHVSLALSCPALMSPLKTVYLSLPPRLRVPVSSSCVHRDRRPDLKVSGAPSHRVLFVFWKVFIFFPVFVSRGKEVAARHPALARGWCVGVRQDHRECRESSGHEICSVHRLWLSQARQLFA